MVQQLMLSFVDHCSKWHLCMPLALIAYLGPFFASGHAGAADPVADDDASSYTALLEREALILALKTPQQDNRLVARLRELDQAARDKNTYSREADLQFLAEIRALKLDDLDLDFRTMQGLSYGVPELVTRLILSPSPHKLAARELEQNYEEIAQDLYRLGDNGEVLWHFFQTVNQPNEIQTEKRAAVLQIAEDFVSNFSGKQRNSWTMGHLSLTLYTMLQGEIDEEEAKRVLQLYEKSAEIVWEGIAAGMYRGDDLNSLVIHFRLLENKLLMEELLDPTQTLFDDPYSIPLP